jgi:hypothetical protein
MVQARDRRATPAAWPDLLVVLHDGRQLEGELVVLTRRYAVGGVVFHPWEIAELEDL